jgi:outer membrane biosynthesis protein TonB
LEAASVLAAGDTIKLRSDRLQVVPPDADLSSYAAKDVYGLGTLLWQCLTQRLPKRTTDANDPSLQLLPQPFVQIVRKALNGKATLEEIAALLHPSAPQPAVSAKPQPVAAAKASVPETTSPTAKLAQPTPKPSSQPQIPLPLAEDDETQTEMSSMRKNVPKNAVWILAGFVVLLFVAGFAIRAMLHSSDHGPAASASPTPETPAVVVAPSTPAPSKPATVARPEPAKPKVVAATVPIAAPVAGTWRVVAFTYNHQDQAEHKAITINSKHPDLQASVFSPKGGGAPYLVTLGSATDRESAFHLRGKAIQEGMPHDTFAQNYSR